MSEILRPASSGKGIVPLEQEAFHKEIMEAAQLAYYENSQARPVKVQVYFTDARGAKQDKHAMAQGLADLAVRNAHRANPFVSLKREWDELKPKWDELPDGFSSVTINSLLAEDWWSGEVGGYDVLIDTRSRSKERLVSTYRANLGENARVWLLLYSGDTVARSMMIPACAQEWKFPFSFDRVFWFASLENEFVEFQMRQ